VSIPVWESMVTERGNPLGTHRDLPYPRFTLRGIPPRPAVPVMPRPTSWPTVDVAGFAAGGTDAEATVRYALPRLPPASAMAQLDGGELPRAAALEPPHPTHE
jgi:hypothetical protein